MVENHDNKDHIKEDEDILFLDEEEEETQTEKDRKTETEGIKKSHHNGTKKKTTSNKKARKIKRESNTPFIVASLFIIIIILIGIVNLDKIMPFIKQDVKDADKDDNIVASVNGNEITKDMLDKEYEQLPVQLQLYINKAVFLNETMIPQILLAEATEKDDITDKEVEDFLAFYLEQLNITREELVANIEEQGKSAEDLNEQIKISLHINKSIGDKIDVTDEEADTFYAENKELITGQAAGATDAQIKEQIKLYLTSQKQAVAVKEYIDELKANADIKIYYVPDEETDEKEMVEKVVEPDVDTKEVGEITTFQDSGDEICKNADGKPIIRVFSTTTCPHCQWIKETLDGVLREYQDAGMIEAHHYEVDIKDDLLTDEKETKIALEELEVFKKYSTGGVPTFVFGCKYTRIGNGHEKKDDGLSLEEAEFRAVIDSLIA